jgi:anti-sigma B factor antagonist
MALTTDTASVRRRGALAVIDLPRQIDISAEATLNNAYARAERASQTILLNFAGVDYINSQGIALIVGLLARARKERRAVEACALSQHYREIFEVTRLSDFMKLFENEDTAVSGEEGAR